MKISKTVADAEKQLWARLASVAAKQAYSAIQDRGDANEAEMFADTAVGWLSRAGADATCWYFEQPRG